MGAFQRVVEDSRFSGYFHEKRLPLAEESSTYVHNPFLKDAIARFSESTAMKLPALREAVRIASAVDHLIESHGELAYDVLFDRDRPQDRKSIMKLARKSTERQLERLEKVMQGTERSIAPRPGDSASDTKTFAKFFSRVGRARGAILQLDLCCKSETRIPREVFGAIQAYLNGYLHELSIFKAQLLSLKLKSGN